MARASSRTYCAPAFLVWLMAGASVEAGAIAVPPGGDLQAALDAASAGDTILLHPGAVYVGNFELPARPGTSFITLQTQPEGLPGPGTRISPSVSSGLAKLRSPNGLPALRTSPGAHHWRIVLIEFLANEAGEGDIIALGEWGPQNTLALVPHDLVIDRCYIHAAPGLPQKRGIALNAAATTVTGSYISGIKSDVQDSQAIAGWNGPGPYAITNNYLEAAGENVMFGGGDPAILNLVPSDIMIADNVFSKPVAWRSERWVVKNLLELKNARRVSIRNNTFEYNWQAAQSGFAILFTVRNQDGSCGWCQVEEVTFENNIVRHVAAGVNILGFDDIHPSRQTQRIVIRNNLFVDVNPDLWGGNGYFLQLLGGAADVTVDHNTVIQEEAFGIVVADGPPVHGFRLTNNLFRHGMFGIIGTDHGPGLPSIAAYMPGSLIDRNVIAEASATYPAGNLIPTFDEFRSQFVSYAGADYRLTPGSAWRGAGTDGRDLGALLPLTLSPPRNDRTDWDGDGVADLVVYRPSGGHWLIGFTDGRRIVEQWGLPGDVPVPGDYDADGRMDPAVFRPSKGTWHILTTTTVTVQWGSSGHVPVPGDYDGDGKSDVAVWHPGTGMWEVRRSSSGTTLKRQWGVPYDDVPVPADYDGDRITDLAVWQTSTGIWKIIRSSDGVTTSRQWGAGYVPYNDVPVPADYDGDMRADVAIWRPAQGLWAVVRSSDGVVSTRQWGAGYAPYNDIPVAADFDGDRKADIAVWRSSIGAWCIIRSSDGVIVAEQLGISTDIPAARFSYAPRHRLAGISDFDGDGSADMAVWSPSTGEWSVMRSSDIILTTQQLGVASDLPVAADYDGDGKIDAAVWSPSTRVWSVRRSSDDVLMTQQWGETGARPVPGDYDGDRKADFAAWHPGTGVWEVRRSSDGSTTRRQWGLPGDLPVPADYDGDRIADLAVWRTSNGMWHIVRSSDGVTTSRQWGAGYAPYDDVPLPADYDGDGKADVAIWRPAQGIWAAIRSSDGGVIARQWGAGYAPYHDVPVPADYDGDRKTDIAVWRRSIGVWSIVRSSDGTVTGGQFGTSNDVPVADQVGVSGGR